MNELDNVKEVIRYILSRSGLPDASVLEAQAERIIAASGPVTMTTLIVEDAARTQRADGPLPVDAEVFDNDQSLGELLIWVRGGKLDLLEFAWWSDDRPAMLPAPSSIRVTTR